ncbi:Uncharacterized protein pbN1_32900 [Aromatoleum bremense]|nr:Uncharacterized protein pbN1_32900 [Aromatoleum bremense]
MRAFIRALATSEAEYLGMPHREIDAVYGDPLAEVPRQTFGAQGARLGRDRIPRGRHRDGRSGWGVSA